MNKIIIKNIITIKYNIMLNNNNDRFGNLDLNVGLALIS